MSRAVSPRTLLAVFLVISLAAVGSLVFVLLGGPFLPDGGGDDDGGLPRAAAQRLRMNNRLQTSVSLPKGIDANTPLKDALEYLSEEYQIPFLIDTPAFEVIGVQRVEEQPVQLPKLMGVSMKTVLRLLLGQVRGDVYTGAFIVQEDHILITTTQRISNAETWTADTQTPAPTIDLHCEKKSLRAALYEIRDASGINVVLDARVGEIGRKPVTISLVRVPADTAARLLADMHGLKMVALDNVLYVTTVENARELQPIADARAAAYARTIREENAAMGVPLKPAGPPAAQPLAPAPPAAAPAPPVPAAVAPPVPRLHGTDEAGRQAAIAAGLEWLVQHQSSDGHWSMSSFHKDANCNCTGPGGQHDVAGTAFALLPLLAAGHTHQDDAQNEGYSKNVENGLKWLLTRQAGDGAQSSNGYEHPMATLVLCEAYRATQDPMLKGPAQRAVDCCVAWQHTGGGFRYTPRTPGDLSVTGWFVQALASARAAELTVPGPTWNNVSDFLDAMSNPEGSAFGYQQPVPAPTMTAVGLLCRSQLRQDWKADVATAKGKQYLTKLPPSPNFKNQYYFYYATRVMNLTDDGRAAWNQKLRQVLIPQQDWGSTSNPHQKGSWSPADDAWGGQLGRLGMTSFALRALQAATPPKPEESPDDKEK